MYPTKQHAKQFVAGYWEGIFHYSNVDVDMGREDDYAEVYADALRALEVADGAMIADALGKAEIAMRTGDTPAYFGEAHTWSLLGWWLASMRAGKRSANTPRDALWTWAEDLGPAHIESVPGGCTYISRTA